MQPIDPERFGSVIVPLVAEPRLNPLGPGEPNRAVRDTLRAFSFARAVAPRPVADEDMARACHAGLWLYHNFLDESHTLSQEIHTPTGSFWHAIMHRREPDPSNSKYWWRRVGNHPVLDQLRAQAPSLDFQFTDPFAFVDFVEQVRGTGDPDEGLAQRVQLLEWQLLFNWCFTKALQGG